MKKAMEAKKYTKVSRIQHGRNTGVDFVVIGNLRSLQTINNTGLKENR